MALRIRANSNLTHNEARAAFNKAMTYLKQSPLAKDIIADLESVNQLLTIYVGTDQDPRKQNVYGHPNEQDTHSAGTIYWDPSVTVGVKDKVKNYKGERLRPDVPWVAKPGTWKCCGKRFGTEQDQLGEISAPVCLVHEMGHAMQYLSDPSGYRAIKKGGGIQPDLEQLNTEAIEQPIILELRKAGSQNGIRWDYLHTV